MTITTVGELREQLADLDPDLPIYGFDRAPIALLRVVVDEGTEGDEELLPVPPGVWIAMRWAGGDGPSPATEDALLQIIEVQR